MNWYSNSAGIETGAPSLAQMLIFWSLVLHTNPEPDQRSIISSAALRHSEKIWIQFYNAKQHCGLLDILSWSNISLLSILISTGLQGDYQC